MLKVWIIQNSCYFRFHKSENFTFHTFIIGFDSLFEIVGAIFICELRDDGNGLIGFHLCRNLGGIHHNLRMENLLVDTFIEIIRHGTDKHALREV